MCKNVERWLFHFNDSSSSILTCKNTQQWNNYFILNIVMLNKHWLHFPTQIILITTMEILKQAFLKSRGFKIIQKHKSSLLMINAKTLIHVQLCWWKFCKIFIFFVHVVRMNHKSNNKRRYMVSRARVNCLVDHLHSLPLSIDPRVMWRMLYIAKYKSQTHCYKDHIAKIINTKIKLWY